MPISRLGAGLLNYMEHNLEYHPLANIFPMLPSVELKSLSEDIRANGQQSPIILYEDKILDGRNRYEACRLIGVAPEFEEYRGDNPTAKVVSLNLMRRHMNESQRAMVAARLANMRQGARTDLPTANLHEVSVNQAAELLNVSPRQVAAAKAILRDSTPEKVAEIDQGKSTVHKETRELARGAAVKKVAESPREKFRVIYSDPPWSYGDSRNGLKGTTGAEAHYPTMSNAELCAIPVAEWCEDNAVLFLWVTSPLLDECFSLIESWGFTYKTSFVWDKVKHNMGHYNSVRHEFLLICTRGSCTPDNVKLFDSVQTIERSQKHSEKPKEFREIIETLYPHGKRLEMFARVAANGWERWGNEV